MPGSEASPAVECAVAITRAEPFGVITGRSAASGSGAPKGRPMRSLGCRVVTVSQLHPSADRRAFGAFIRSAGTRWMGGLGPQAHGRH